MQALQKLREIKKNSGEILTHGLDEEDILRILNDDSSFPQDIFESAWNCFENLKDGFGWFFEKDEIEQIKIAQKSFVNFYDENTVNPYVTLVSKGPWVITTCGALIHDSGGYGMLGFGHNNEAILKAISQPQVMANIMTPNITQLKFIEAITNEIGHKRSNKKTFSKFLCMNSGSEAVSVALRIADTNAKYIIEKKQIKKENIYFLSLKRSFHGRTDRPSQASDSSLGLYKKNLASFNTRENLITIAANDIDSLKKAFDWAKKEKVFFEAMLIEPVMGEGIPGRAITSEFYKAARELTLEHETLLIVDSIQAGLRCHGVLSIVDYPGFESLPAPDMETYSKALNCGQFPLSVLAMNERAAVVYKQGTYGNTMTANPRGLEVACSTLSQMTPEIRENIITQGKRFKNEFKKLWDKYPDLVTGVEGTGLLCSIFIDENKAEVVAKDGMEMWLRRNGLGVIHGGKNAIRLTPHFGITDSEIDLVISMLDKALKNFSN